MPESMRGTVWRILFAAMALGAAPFFTQAFAQEGTPGLTEPVVFPPYNPAAPACTAPAGLEQSLGFAKDNTRQFIEGLGYGLRMAAEDRNLAYEEVVANNDHAAQVPQIEDFIARRFGAIVAHPVDPAALVPTLQEAIWSGAYVGSVVSPPATLVLNAPQYLTGRVLGEDAARHIREELGGKANVVLLTQDSLQFLAARFVAIRDALQDLPGVTIIADISPNPVSEAGGYATMQLILQAHSDIDVVLGADAVVLGALRALREAGRARPDQYLGGIDGDPEAVAEIRIEDSPYKASIALSSPVFGYAMGMFAADWLEGKSVPQAMDILPRALTFENLPQYEADLADPAEVYADPARRDAYLRMYGNICYDSRDQYVNFPWSSEAQ